LSIPRFGSRRVARIDVAWPMSGGGKEAVWSFGSSQAF